MDNQPKPQSGIDVLTEFLKTTIGLLSLILIGLFLWRSNIGESSKTTPFPEERPGFIRPSFRYSERFRGKAEELDRIQVMLRQLDAFVANQKSELQNATKALEDLKGRKQQLEDEKKELERQKKLAEDAMTIDQAKLATMLSELHRENELKKYLDWAIAIILGVLSNLATNALKRLSSRSVTEVETAPKQETEQP